MSKTNNVKLRKIPNESIDDTTTNHKDKPDHKVPKKNDKNKKDKKFPITPAIQPLTHRIWTRTVMVSCFLIIMYFFTRKDKEIKFATQKELIPLRFQKIQCSQSYLNDIKDYPKCTPKHCGRFVTDTLIDKNDIKLLLDIAQSGINLGGSSGGASILDLHSGALSKNENFINVYTIPKAKEIFKRDHLITYQMVKYQIRHAIAEKFQIDENSLYLTYPTFFSRITNETAKTIHDEYWHPHIDKETYESFHFTSLLYLTDFQKNFTGGRFIFIDGNNENNNKTTTVIEPKIGRLSVFTSGAENVHAVENVTSGIRYAITISFTCNPKFAIKDPDLNLEN